jgi:hypothetical protein
MTYVIFLPSPTPSHCTVHWCQIHSPWLRDIVDYIPCCGLRIGFLYTTFFCTTIPSSIVTSFYLWTLSAVLWICIGFNMDPEPALYINADPDPRFLWPEIKILFFVGLHEGYPSNMRSLEISLLFFFCEPFLPSWIRIRIPIPNLESDPQHCFPASCSFSVIYIP